MQYYLTSIFNLMIFTKAKQYQVLFKNALTFSIDVERSFTVFKNMLTDYALQLIERKT